MATSLWAESSSPGQVLTRNIAAFDGTNWNALGMGVDDEVLAMLADSNNLIVGGWFTSAGGIIVNYIATFDMSIGRWSPLVDSYGNVGLEYYVNALAMDQGLSSLFIAGDFSYYDNNYFIKWDGSNFWPFGNQTGDIGINSIRIANANNAPSNSLFSSGRVMVVYGSIQLGGDDTVSYGSAIFDGINWIPDTSVINSCSQTFNSETPILYGYAEQPPSSTWALSAGDIAAIVIMTIFGVAVIVGVIVFFVMRRKSHK